jgi:acetolactate decarboxylase
MKAAPKLAKKAALLSAITFIIVSCFCGCGCPKIKKDVLFQVSTLKALKDADLDGRLSIKELKNKGDFGIGTFTGLSGEMLELDGVVYQINADGSAAKAAELLKTPFADVTFFSADKKHSISETMDYAQLCNFLKDLLPDKNMIYAIKIEGDFSYLKTRSISAQKKPYAGLDIAIKNQTVLEQENVKGVLVGFWFPEYMDKIVSTGFHFHFLSADKRKGGHLLDCQLKSGQIAVDDTGQFMMQLSNKSYDKSE